MKNRMIFSGFGGQGALSAGKTLAEVALQEDKNVTWLPTYGSERRGGVAYCRVFLSDTSSTSPVFEDLDALIALDSASVDRFKDCVIPGGILLYNSSLTEKEPDCPGVQVQAVPCNELAASVNNPGGVNFIALGSYLAMNECVSVEAVVDHIDHMFTGRKAVYAEMNRKAVLAGYDYIRKQNGVV